MLKKTVTYTDYDGVERTEDCYFNLTNAEITEMELGVAGGMSSMLTRIINAKDTPEMIHVFKELILKAYGVKSDDGRRFIKDDKLAQEFAQTEAYSMIFMELATDDKAAADFVNGIVPASSRASQAQLDEARATLGLDS